MAGTFNTTLLTELKFKPTELNHIAEIYTKCHLTNKLLHYNLILCGGILHEQGMYFNFEIKKNDVARSFGLFETTLLYSKRILCNQRKSPSPKYN